MQRYELILGLKPDLPAERSKKILERIKDLIDDLGGKVGEVKGKGLIKLAYPVEGSTEASFTTILFTIPGAKIESLQKKLGQIKDILRTMIIREEVKQ